MTFEEWAATTGMSHCEYSYAKHAWQAAQKELIQKAWNIYGEDLADGLMQLCGIEVECPPEEDDD